MDLKCNISASQLSTVKSNSKNFYETTGNWLYLSTGIVTQLVRAQVTLDVKRKPNFVTKVLTKIFCRSEKRLLS